MNEIYEEIKKAGRKCSADKIILFGSRARGDNRERSDIDIAVFGLSKEKQIIFTEMIEELPTLLSLDVVFVSDNTSEPLLNNINKDGVTLMSKFTEKYDKFVEAVKRLEEALTEYQSYKISSSRDGVIQRFEFCTELAWKTLREYLLEEGYVDINSPKAVLKRAYADGIVTDEQSWLALLNARNLTSHIYDDNTASVIFEDISVIYIHLFNELEERLK